MRDPKAVWGIPWPFEGLNALTGGIQREEMTILMARPGVGKTSFLGQTALSIATWLLTDEGRKDAPGQVVKLVLCEMSAHSFQQRLACNQAKLGMRRVREGRLTDAQMRRYDDALETIAELPIQYLDAPRSLEGTERWLMGGDTPCWWACDYIGIHPLNPAHEPSSQWQKVSQLSAGFRQVCKHIAPGLILAQMNREIEKRDDPRPRLSDLRDSGTLEQDAWNVLALHRDDIYKDVAPEDRDRPKPAALYVLKQRQGPLGVVEMRWLPKASAYEDISEEWRKMEQDDGDVD